MTNLQTTPPPLQSNELSYDSKLQIRLPTSEISKIDAQIRNHRSDILTISNTIAYRRASNLGLEFRSNIRQLEQEINNLEMEKQKRQSQINMLKQGRL